MGSNSESPPVTFRLDFEEDPEKKISCSERFFVIFAMLAIFLCPISLLCCFKVVKQYKRAVILRFGRLRADSPAGPGIIFINPCIDVAFMIDMRTQSVNLRPHEILTKDSVTVTVDAVVYFHVINPLFALLNVESHMRATELLSGSTLRNILGQYSLQDLLTSREKITLAVRTEIAKRCSAWGVQVERVEIKDIYLPFNLQKAMAAEAEGTRIGKAKIIEAEGEIKAAEHLREASRIMMENPKMLHERALLSTVLAISNLIDTSSRPIAWLIGTIFEHYTTNVRYLQTLTNIGAQQTTSILFPVPFDSFTPESASRYTT